MISENPSLLTANKSNRIKISRIKKNEFKILDSIYYYRTNDEYERNYFFMNIVSPFVTLVINFSIYKSLFD